MTTLAELMISYECAAFGALVELAQQDADPETFARQLQHCRELRRQMKPHVPECETVETQLTVEWIR